MKTVLMSAAVVVGFAFALPAMAASSTTNAYLGYTGNAGSMAGGGSYIGYGGAAGASTAPGNISTSTVIGVGEIETVGPAHANGTFGGSASTTNTFHHN